jgi:hypothetical protein
MTASERKTWNDEAAKGAYNYTDLNRVETVVAEIAALLGFSLTTKTDWSLWDIPVKSDMDRYLDNVRTIRNYCTRLGNASDFPTLPTSMDDLTLEGANNIEKVLKMAYRYTSGNSSSVLGEGVLGEMVLGNEL